ncbi:hypothetical protein BC938DRAFT_473307 [Jimgerdemannia flammicorona]|uniref:Methyltransferase type 11 domain-containing protein n=1 Tax=Jimgerdemannia flammicorona TaxID=994334 RepID=A0A433Q4F5_9FUNG|nr:hypothetical protein BC938DRAFT_473307 [Jimgerdemannia flammicorona]
MQLSFTPAEWPYALAELRRVTKHGGVVELIEPCVMMERSPPSYTWFYETVSGAAKLRGMDIDFVMSDMTALLTRAGLEKIEADYVSSPLGWGGKAGEIGMRNIEFLIQAMRRTVLGESDVGQTVLLVWEEAERVKAG